MKPTLLSLLLIALLTWTGCGEDDDVSVQEFVNYDGPNVSAPQLPPGTNTFGVYFPASVMQGYTGRSIDAITFYVTSIPEATTVKIFADGPDNRTPGDELYSRDITNRVSTTEWYTDRLQSPYEITGEGIWLAVEVELAPGAPISIGCDSGQSFDPNGNLLYLSTENEWQTFQEITGERVNWNIRGVLSEG